MKRISIPILMALLLMGLTPALSHAVRPYAPLNASQRFVWQNPLPQGNTFNDVDFVDDNVGWTIGDNGTVIKTTDGGYSWEQQGPIVPQGADDIDAGAYDVCFVDANNGYVAADGRVYRTLDGGANWSTTSAWFSTGGPYIPYLSIDFADANTGWLVGQYSVWRATNGGTSVTSQTLPADVYPNEVSAGSAVVAYMCGVFDGYAKTSDAGVTWTRHEYTGTSHVGAWTDSIAAVSGNKVYAATGGDVLLTIDGGSTWTTMTVGNDPASDPVSRVFLCDSDLTGAIAYAVTDAGKLYRTNDSGATPWTLLATVPSAGAFDAPSSTSVFALSGGRLIGSVDGGSSFSNRYSGAWTDFTAVDFSSETTGYAAGDHALSTTSDGGLTWSSQDLSAHDLHFNDVFFLEADPSIGWLVGSPGTGGPMVLKTTDAGQSWASQPATDLAARRVFFTDADTGWMVNNTWGGFWRTSDGGASWSKVSRDAFFNDVEFVDSQNGWLAMDEQDGDDKLLHTTDGGSTWTTQTAGHSGGNVDAIDFIDANTGYALHSFDGLYKTTNGGASWTPVDVSAWSPTFDLVDVRFTTATDGWVIGAQRTSTALPTYRHDFAAHTRDGGVTWDFEDDPDRSDGGSTGSAVYIKEMDSVDASNTWIVGGNGAILKSIPQTPAVDPEVTRVAGSDRYAVAANLAYKGWNTDAHWGETANVIVACGDPGKEADPLAAAGLAGAYDCPILLTKVASLPSSTRSAIASMAAAPGHSALKVHIVGGTGSVPDAIWNQIKAIPGVSATKDRITGSDRYAVTAAIAYKMRSVLGTDAIPGALIVCSENSNAFYDALAASPIAFAEHRPMLGVRTTAVPSSVGNVLRSPLLAGKPHHVVSSSTYISAGTYTLVGGTGTRLATSSNRYTAATQIAARAHTEGWLEYTDTGMASALADALGGGAFMGNAGGILLYTTPTSSIQSTTRSWIDTNSDDITHGWIFGGTGSVPDSQRTQFLGLLE